MAVSDEENLAAAELDPDYAAGKKAIEAKHWNAAITASPRQRCATRAMLRSRTTSVTPT
jgi:hypothetical protein